jgi:hypothetical protein
MADLNFDATLAQRMYEHKISNEFYISSEYNVDTQLLPRH